MPFWKGVEKEATVYVVQGWCHGTCDGCFDSRRTMK
jgi:hypothetical protein